MATFTPNYNLRKPTDADLVTVATDIAASMDTIDTELLDHETQLTAVEARATVLEVPPHFGLIRKSAVQSIPDNATTALVFGTNAHSRPAGFANEANDRLVIPVAGWYDVELQIAYAANATGRRDGILLVNAANVRIIRLASVVNLAAFLQAKWTLLLAANDLLTMNVLQNSGGALDVSAGAANTSTETYLSAQFLMAGF